MKKLFSLIAILSLLICWTSALTACAPVEPDNGPKALPAPALSLVGDTAMWKSVEGAVGYELSIGLGLESCDASVTSKQLSNGDTLLVRAVGDGINYKTSPWSNSVTYGEKSHEQPEKPALPTPTVTLSGAVASWNAVSGAVGYELSIGVGTTVSVGADVLSYTLSDGDTLIVRAKAAVGSENTHSEWSLAVKYTASGEDPDGGNGSGCTAHTDTDTNGICDVCRVSVVVVIDFYAINDLHGRFCDTSKQPGVDELATYLKGRESIDDNVVVLASGDMWQGTAESNLTYGRLMTEWMNIVGTVSMTLGNHEFDWGESYIRENLAVADFPFLAINVYDVDTGERADYCAPSIMIDEGGVQVGIIGAIGDCYSSILADMVAGVEFKVGGALTALVKAEASRLRALGADVIIYSLHDNTSGYDTALSNGYVDLAFEAHSHSWYVNQDSYGVYHIQAGAENDGISHAEIGVNTVTGSVAVNEANIIGSGTYSAYDDDPETEALEDKYPDIIEIATTPIGTVDAYMNDSAIEDLVAKLYYDAGVERWGGQYNIVLGGGFLKTREPYCLEVGSVTYGDLMSILPFNNQLVLCSVSGEKLLSRFINKANGDYHCYYTVSASSISADATYYIVVDTYTAAYAPNGLTSIERYDETTYARDLLADYIKDGNLGSGSQGPTLTSIADAISIGGNLPLGNTTAEFYYVRGTIESIVNTTNGLKFGNMYLTDGAGNTIYLYGLSDSYGNLYQDIPNKPGVGDEILVFARIQNYDNSGVSIIELKSGTLVR